MKFSVNRQKLLEEVKIINNIFKQDKSKEALDDTNRVLFYAVNDYLKLFARRENKIYKNFLPITFKDEHRVMAVTLNILEFLEALGETKGRTVSLEMKHAHADILTLKCKGIRKFLIAGDVVRYPKEIDFEDLVESNWIKAIHNEEADEKLRNLIGDELFNKLGVRYENV